MPEFRHRLDLGGSSRLPRGRVSAAPRESGIARCPPPPRPPEPAPPQPPRPASKGHLVLVTLRTPEPTPTYCPGRGSWPGGLEGETFGAQSARLAGWWVLTDSPPPGPAPMLAREPRAGSHPLPTATPWGLTPGSSGPGSPSGPPPGPWRLHRQCCCWRTCKRGDMGGAAGWGEARRGQSPGALQGRAVSGLKGAQYTVSSA